MNKIIFVIAIILVIIGAVLYAVLNKGDRAAAPVVAESTPPEPPPVEELIVEPTPIELEQNIVIYTDSGFDPGILTIKAGESVVFKNQSSQPFWPASAMHPTHKVYPGSNIEKCGTAEAIAIFDSCGGIIAGSEWTFKFNAEGTWGYHNHLDSKRTGKIIVE